VALVAVVALMAPADAFAHATLLRTAPQDGAVLKTAPRVVTVFFDDTVRVAKGNAAVANATSASVMAGKAVAHGRTIAIPLRANLPDGAYSVRWSVVSDDGHQEEGVLAFAAGAGAPAPKSVLGAAVPLTWNEILLRTLYYLGLLVGGGAAAFGLATRDLLGEPLRKPLAQLLFFALLSTFLGGSGIVHAAPPGTRFDLVLKVALTLSLLGGAAAALAPNMPRLVPAAGAVALALLLGPTLSGHALDRNQVVVLTPLVDLAHTASAAVWLGGLLALIYVVPRATGDDAIRRATAHRFSSLAGIAVAVLGVTGLLRALTELSSVSQVWSTSYGRALIVKTAIFVPLLYLGWINRTMLLDAFARLRRSARLEVVAIAGIVVTVAILTELRPGKEAPKAQAAVPVAALPPVLPPRDAVVDARELGDLAVAIAREPDRTTVTILDGQGAGSNGHGVTVDGAATVTCGAGCYRAPGGERVSVDGHELDFAIPASSSDATAKLAAVTRSYRASKTVVFDETLASPATSETTRFILRAPNTLAYQTRNGPAAIVLGARRWDRDAPGAKWVFSQQTPLDVMQPYWRSPTNVHEVAPGTFTFLDRRIPAWFRVTVAHGRPAVEQMTAAAHFMTDRYVGFDGPVTVSPPSR
jgi:copper transport protein